jgi:DNA-binding Xre family transcriptional regulator
MRPKPKGLGTGQVQSLRSYLYDVSVLHSLTLGRLVWECSARSRREDPLRKLNQYWSSQNHHLVTTFESLTVRDDLQFLTMLPWEILIASEGLIDRRQKWCPACLKETPYERLLWTLAEAKCCPVHGIELEQACTSCGAVGRASSSRPSWAYCRCGFDHGEGKQARQADEDSIWASNQLSKLLAHAYSRPSIEKGRIRDIWSRVVFPMFPSKTEAARVLGLSDAMVYMALERSYRMTMPKLLGICRALELDLPDLLTKDISLLKPNLCPAKTPLAKRKILSKAELHQKIVEALAKTPKATQTQRSIAAAVGLSTARLQQQFPDIAERLVRERKNRMRTEAKRKNAVIIRKMVEMLREDSGISTKALAAVCGISLFQTGKALVARARALAQDPQLEFRLP